MAKHKKHHKKTHRRKRSTMGAVNGGDILFAVMGGIGGRLIDKIVPASVSPKLVSGGKVALGILAPLAFKSGRAKSMAQSFGAGMAVIGVTDLLHAFGVVNGPDNEPTLDIHLDGTNDIPVINGDDEDILNGMTIPVINGDDEDL